MASVAKSSAKQEKVKEPKIVTEDIFVISKDKSAKVSIDIKTNKIQSINESTSEDLFDLFRSRSMAKILPYDCIMLESQENEHQGYVCDVYYLQKPPTTLNIEYLSKKYSISVPFTVWKVPVQDSKYILDKSIYMYFSKEDLRHNPNAVLFHPQLPNCWGNESGNSGLLCMGSVSFAKGMSIIDKVSSIPNIFWGSRFNREIAPEKYHSIIAKHLSDSKKERIDECISYGDVLYDHMHDIFTAWQKQTEENPLFWFEKGFKINDDKFSLSSLRSAEINPMF